MGEVIKLVPAPKLSEIETKPDNRPFVITGIIDGQCGYANRDTATRKYVELVRPRLGKS